MQRPFHQVDVFASEGYRGNPVAVIGDGDNGLDGLTTADMQRIANWTNLSETTYLLAPTVPGAHYRVRIFTPVEELPFAGHPTLGTCHAWLEAHPDHAADTVVQECGVGLVTIRRGDTLAFAAPPLIRSGPLSGDEMAATAQRLGIAPSAIVDAAWADNGPGWIAVRLADVAAVLALQPNLGPDDAIAKIGVVAPYPPGGPADFEVRAFFTKGGITTEDPVTGSLNASLAQWMVGSGSVAAPYTVSQGTVLGRQGRVAIGQDATGTIWVGGATTTCVAGVIHC